MPLADLLALLPDNTTGEISPADLRTIITDLYTTSGVQIAPGPWNGLAASAAFIPFPTPVPPVVTMNLAVAGPLLICISGYIDTVNNNNEVALGLDVTGATTIPAGSSSGQTLRLGARQATKATDSLSYVQMFNAGLTSFEARYTSQLSGTNISDMAMSAVRLGS